MDLLLFLFLLSSTSIFGGGGCHPPALDTTGASSTERRGEGKVDVLLRIQSNDERRDVDHLLSDTNMPLPDQHPRMMDRLGQPVLEHLGLQPPLQEILHLQRQHVIEAHTTLVQDTDADKPADEGVALEKALGVFGFELEQLTSGATDFGECQGDAPNLALVAEAIFADELELCIETS